MGNSHQRSFCNSWNVGNTVPITVVCVCVVCACGCVGCVVVGGGCSYIAYKIKFFVLIV